MVDFAAGALIAGFVVIFILVACTILISIRISKVANRMAKDFPEDNEKKKEEIKVTRYATLHPDVPGKCYLITFRSTSTKFNLYDAYRQSVMNGWFNDDNADDLFLFLDLDTKFIYRKTSMTLYTMYVNGHVIHRHTESGHSLTTLDLGDLIIDFENVNFDK